MAELGPVVLALHFELRPRFLFCALLRCQRWYPSHMSLIEAVCPVVLARRRFSLPGTPPPSAVSVSTGLFMAGAVLLWVAPGP